MKDNHTALFTCDEGFGLHGTSALFCHENGTWNETQPYCQGLGWRMIIVLANLGHAQKKNIVSSVVTYLLTKHKIYYLNLTPRICWPFDPYPPRRKTHTHKHNTHTHTHTHTHYVNSTCEYTCISYSPFLFLLDENLYSESALLINKSEDPAVTLHGRVTLSCTFNGSRISPLKTFWWVPNMSTAVYFGEATNMSISVIANQTIIDQSTVESTLTLVEFSPKLEGQYLCGAENAAGHEQELGKILVQLSPSNTGPSAAVEWPNGALISRFQVADSEKSTQGNSQGLS